MGIIGYVIFKGFLVLILSIFLFRNVGEWLFMFLIYSLNWKNCKIVKYEILKNENIVLCGKIIFEKYVNENEI